MSKIFLKYLYLKTLLNQKIFRDGSFPYKNYNKLTEYVEKYNIQNALECGTAIGLTSAAILLGNEKIKIDTIERHARNINRARANIKRLDILNKNKKEIISESFLNRVNFIEGLYFDVLETPEYKYKKYDLIFLDCYISRYNEVVFLSNYLKSGGIFIVSNIREDMIKSKLAKSFLTGIWSEPDLKMKKSHNLPYKIGEDNKFEILEIVDDTIFARKI